MLETYSKEAIPCVEVTLQVSPDLADRIKSAGAWSPTILALVFAGFRTNVMRTASELIEFLETNPSPKKVMKHHASEEAQARLFRLLKLNEAGVLTEEEELELDEVIRLDRIVFNLKLEAVERLKRKK